MVKNKLFSRFGAVFFIILMVAAMIIPASAATIYSDNALSAYPFDTISAVYNDEEFFSAPWFPRTGSSLNSWESIEDYETSNRYYSATSFFINNRISGFINFDDSVDSLVLRSKQFLWTPALSLEFTYDETQPINFMGASISFDLVTIRDIPFADSYQIVTQPIDYSYTGFIPDTLYQTRFNVGNFISKALSGSGISISQDNYYMLTNVVLEIFVEPESNVFFYYSSDVYEQYFSDPFVEWFDRMDLTYEVIQTDRGNFFEWISASADSFLDFQIAPDFSFNDIANFLITVGLLLWFLRLIS